MLHVSHLWRAEENLTKAKQQQIQYVNSDYHNISCYEIVLK